MQRPASARSRAMPSTPVLKLWTDPAPGPLRAAHWRFNVPEPHAEIGKHVHVRPYQRPHPPIAVAGIGPRPTC